MAFDGILTQSIVHELKNTISGGKINKVYEPNKNEIILDIYNKQKYLLDICIEPSNYRINLTTHFKENPKVAPNFCMVLRKYLTSSKIINISTYNLDRIVIITLENYNELNDKVKYKLIIELMGKHSNIILLNDKNIIIDSIRHISGTNALRNILPANPYIFPISNKFNLLDVSQDEFVKIINSKSPEDLITILSNAFTGVSKSFIYYTLELLNISYTTFNNNDLINLYCYIQNILIGNSLSIKEFIYNNKKDFTVFIAENSSSLPINKFIDNFYFDKENNELFVNYRNSILKLILNLLNKSNKKLANIQIKLNKCNDIDLYKLYGELITANLYRIDNQKNLTNIELENYYDNNNLINIKLDNKYSPSINAKNFFKKYNKLKNTFVIVSKQKEDIANEISYLESIVYSLENTSNISDVNEIYQEISFNILKKPVSEKNMKSKNSEQNITSIEIDGYRVYIGKNNKQNDFITFKLSDKNDIWFHVQDFHGSHILLKTNNKIIDDDNGIILKCATLAAKYSKACKEKKALVDYTLIKNVKKPKNAKPGFVIFNNYHTIVVDG